MRRHYAEIAALGAEVVAIGTGDQRYARAFIQEERIPFPVLVDDDGRAARAAAVRTGTMLDLMAPTNFTGALNAMMAGHRQRRSGPRPFQLGATFVVGPGDQAHYEHLDRDTADHAPLGQVLAVLRNLAEPARA